jgi:hypothetical protein
MLWKIISFLSKIIKIGFQNWIGIRNFKYV